MVAANLSTSGATMAGPEHDVTGGWFARRWFAFAIVAVAAMFCLLRYDYEKRLIREDAERAEDAKLASDDGRRGIRVM